MFTQLNQYRVVLEVKPEFRQNADGAPRHLRDAAPSDGTQVRCRSTP